MRTTAHATSPGSDDELDTAAARLGAREHDRRTTHADRSDRDAVRPGDGARRPHRGGRDARRTGPRALGGAGWFIAWLLSFGCLLGLNVANARGKTGLALVLLLAFGLLVGWSVASTVNYYAATDPVAVRQAFAATALFVGGLGAAGYAVRRDLSFLYRAVVLAAAGAAGRGHRADLRPHPGRVHDLVGRGLAIFGLYTVVDFNRLRHAGTEEAIPLAACIFLDVLNIFLLFLRLFARSS